MSPNLVLALELTVVGMGLVFGSILLFWGLMAGLVRLTAARQAPAAAGLTGAPDRDEALTAVEAAAVAQAVAEEEARRTAAALAVAVLMAREGARPRALERSGWTAWRAAARMGRF